MRNDVLQMYLIKSAKHAPKYIDDVLIVNDSQFQLIV